MVVVYVCLVGGYAVAAAYLALGVVYVFLVGGVFVVSELALGVAV